MDFHAGSAGCHHSFLWLRHSWLNNVGHAWVILEDIPATRCCIPILEQCRIYMIEHGRIHMLGHWCTYLLAYWWILMPALSVAIIHSQGSDIRGWTWLAVHEWSWQRHIALIVQFFPPWSAIAFTWSDKSAFPCLALLHSLAFTLAVSHAESIKPQSFFFRVRKIKAVQLVQQIEKSAQQFAPILPWKLWHLCFHVSFFFQLLSCWLRFLISRR